MSNFVNSGGKLEKRMGGFTYLLWIVFLAVSGGFLTMSLYSGIGAMTQDLRWNFTQTFGFSGVIFALMAYESMIDTSDRR
jgi:membrane associated rhomboid family serine protease